MLGPPQAMLAGCAYAVSPTGVLLLCLWAALSQAVLLWTFFWGLSGTFALEAALSLGLQCLFLLNFTIDLLLEPTHLLLQLTNEIHHSLTDTVRGKKREKL